MFLEFSQYSQENTCAGVSILSAHKACTFIKKRLQHRCFTVNIAKPWKTAFFIEHLRWQKPNILGVVSGKYLAKILGRLIALLHQLGRFYRILLLPDIKSYIESIFLFSITSLIRIVIFYCKKMRFSTEYFFSKCGQIRSFLRIWSHLLKKSFKKNFIISCSFLYPQMFFDMMHTKS